MENSLKERKIVSKKRRILSIAEKLEIIEYFDKSKLGLSDVARELNLPRPYVANLLKDKQKYQQHVSEGRNINIIKSRSVLRKHLPLENAMKLFVHQAMTNNLKLTISDISNKALIFGIKLGLKDFKACGGWVVNFIQRHKVHVTNVKQNTSCDNLKHEENVPAQLELIGQYCTKDIYSIAKFGLFYKCLPEHTDILYSKTCRDGSFPEQRLTVVCSANMDGSEKLPLLVIGNEKEPASFKHLQSLPVDYTSAHKSWINWDLFRSWILKLDAKFQENERNVLMFAQDYGHLKRLLQYELKAINLQFLSTNKQPLDYGVITELKRSYRQNLVKWSRKNDEQTQPRCLTTLDAIDMLARCWNVGVSPETIQNGFKKAGFPLNDEDPLAATFHLSEVATAKANMEPFFDKYCAVDQNVACQGVLSDADILQTVKGEGAAEPSCAENYSEEGESREFTIQSDLQFAIEYLSRSLQLIRNVPPCMFEHLSVVEDFFQRRGKLKVS